MINRNTPIQTIWKVVRGFANSNNDKKSHATVNEHWIQQLLDSPTATAPMDIDDGLNLYCTNNEVTK